MPYFQPGANIDTRTEEEKLKDFSFKETVASANPVNWTEKDKSQWRRFPDQDQNGSGSCVMQTIRKLAGILLWLKEGTYIPFSGAFYQLRSNRPTSGMQGVEAFDIWKDNGLPLEQLSPSEKMSDSQMDAIVVEQYEKDIAKIFKIGGHVGIDKGQDSFETVASIIQTTGKGVMLWFYFTTEEWSKEIPTVLYHNLTIESGLRHSVTAVDYFLFGGKKYLLIEDSAHFSGFTYHLISEEFFAERNWFIRYPMSFVFNKDIDNSSEIELLKHTFVTPFKFGDTSQDVIALQNILKYEGLFPTNIASTGYYGAITAKGVLGWQLKHGVDSEEELNSLQGRRVGMKTIEVLNTFYKK